MVGFVRIILGLLFLVKEQKERMIRLEIKIFCYLAYQ